ncbi:MAG TPA: bifunctional glutamate N-acetyltransferase/amino-acid acetyltransferase ArgJ [Gammaproteobacteria bacterium]|nr:bifunctional glutamate N-acetyltransferase/amino-acid acetyltransferase ArgJ [Gammaproteobacteria bacterium]
MAVGKVEHSPLLPVTGVRLSACSASLYKKTRPDLAIIAIDANASVAAVFTRNAFCGAPVIVARDHLDNNHSPAYLLINAGNANAGTGKQGIADSRETCQCLANLGNVPVTRVLPFSTGVIGEPLPTDRICRILPQLHDSLAADNWDAVARAIMTTDTIKKGISRQLIMDGQKITITGIAKGSGMIKPDMATMLAFIATDAAIDKSVLQEVLNESVEESFNCISVDGDTSTNDACVLIATGKAGNTPLQNVSTAEAAAFRDVLHEVCLLLAQAIIRDGEGATKFITLKIRGGRDRQECHKVAEEIAHSPLIKTALFASDPNWGRILAAVGRAGVPDLDIETVQIYLDDICIVDGGERAPSYSEEAGREVLARSEINICVDLNRGNVSLQFWTCDLSYEYVRINAEYRT